MHLNFSYFAKQIAKLQSLESTDSGLIWVDGFGLGSIVEGKVHEIKEFGVVVAFEQYDDVFGFISGCQCKTLSWYTVQIYSFTLLFP